MNCARTFLALCSVFACQLLADQNSPSVHYIKPGDDPQAVLDKAAPGDKLVFLPGLHRRPLGRYQSMLYVDKPIDIELSSGATLRLPDHQTVLLPDPEITTDHGAAKKIDDFSVGGTYDLGLGSTIFTIQIDSEGTSGTPDTFRWGTGKEFASAHEKIPITGAWQTLSNGVQIRFDKTTGHNAGSLWFISYDGLESYGIRVGHGLQREYIENVRIYGKGTIDLNSKNNVQPSGLVKNISACVLIHGRVRNVLVEGITMTNTMRSVMVYGEHSGKFLQGGGSLGGESFDAEKISILYTRTINPGGAAYLLGHPSHRGRLSKVRCNFNYMETATTSLEPNFNLDQYEVIGNVIKSGGRAIHCWRKSTNGLITDNVRIDDTTGLEVVMVNAPGGWETPENLVIRDNRNHLSDKIGFWGNVSGGMENRAEARFSTVGGGFKNVSRGVGSTVTGGAGNEAVADYSQAQGLNARSVRPGEEALASGFFAVTGDAQSSHLVAKQLTTDDQPKTLMLAGGAPLSIPDGASVSYHISVVARSEGGWAKAAFEANGVASRTSSGDLALFGNKVAPVYKDDPVMDFQVVADPKSKSMRLEARGVKGTTMRWVASVELTEVHF